MRWLVLFEWFIVKFTEENSTSMRTVVFWSRWPNWSNAAEGRGIGKTDPSYGRKFVRPCPITQRRRVFPSSSCRECYHLIDQPLDMLIEKFLSRLFVIGRTACATFQCSLEHNISFITDSMNLFCRKFESEFSNIHLSERFLLNLGDNTSTQGCRVLWQR